MTKVKYIDGNLLDFPEGINVIAHCANCQNKFGSGIALALKQKYPESYAADSEAAQKSLNMLGEYSLAKLKDGKIIANIYGQKYYGKGRQVNYEAFYTAFESLRNYLTATSMTSGTEYRLGVPYKIASDRAGGSWRVIEAMLLDVFENSNIELYIVKLQ